jgi:hypothetical protein
MYLFSVGFRAGDCLTIGMTLKQGKTASNFACFRLTEKTARRIHGRKRRLPRGSWIFPADRLDAYHVGLINEANPATLQPNNDVVARGDIVKYSSLGTTMAPPSLMRMLAGALARMWPRIVWEFIGLL